MFSGPEITSTLREMGVTHVVWVPDSTLGQWEESLEASAQLQLIRVCREGEAWPLAAGLITGGSRPLVMMQSTGFFESGDAVRNVVFDLQIPVFALVGARNWLLPDSPDSARRFIMPLLQAWGLDFKVIENPDQKDQLAAHYSRCRATNTPGIAVLAEGTG